YDCEKPTFARRYIIAGRVNASDRNTTSGCRPRTSARKGRNNSLTAGPDDVGSPYAIGSPDGGHTAVHPQLGTLESFRALV
ncbi:hypothetical protein, partial [Burkholderia cenocepacia]|uniref:hypothetical protein n=1 Tax=Burkholderia cenocepacia TaxID=95486 RepID=UPI0024B7FCD1